MNKQELAIKLDKALNKLCKWRSVFAGWQLGTRSDTDPESRAVRDHREVTMLLRAESNAIDALLISKASARRKSGCSSSSTRCNISTPSTRSASPASRVRSMAWRSTWYSRVTRCKGGGLDHATQLTADQVLLITTHTNRSA